MAVITSDLSLRGRELCQKKMMDMITVKMSHPRFRAESTRMTFDRRRQIGESSTSPSSSLEDAVVVLS